MGKHQNRHAAQLFEYYWHTFNPFLSIVFLNCLFVCVLPNLVWKLGCQASVTRHVPITSLGMGKSRDNHPELFSTDIFIASRGRNTRRENILAPSFSVLFRPQRRGSVVIAIFGTFFFFCIYWYDICTVYLQNNKTSPNLC